MKIKLYSYREIVKRSKANKLSGNDSTCIFWVDRYLIKEWIKRGWLPVEESGDVYLYKCTDFGGFWEIPKCWVKEVTNA